MMIIIAESISFRFRFSNKLLWCMVGGKLLKAAGTQKAKLSRSVNICTYHRCTHASSSCRYAEAKW